MKEIEVFLHKYGAIAIDIQHYFARFVMLTLLFQILWIVRHVTDGEYIESMISFNRSSASL